MRKIIPFLVVSILVLGGLGASASQGEKFEIQSKKVVFSQPTFTNENEFVSLNINEANSFIMEQGKPMLPSYVETFKFPFGTKIKSISATPRNIQTQTLSQKIIPTPVTLAVGQKIVKNVDNINYGIETYPESWFTYDIGTGLDGPVRTVFVNVEVSPVKYHPAKNTIDVASEVDINIQYVSPSEPVSFNDE